MNNRDTLIALHHIEGVGWKTIQRIVNRFPHLHDCLQLHSKNWQELGIVPSKADALAAAFGAISRERLHILLKRYASLGFGILTIYDEQYPMLLKQIAQPPWVLYYIGNLQLLHRPCIAVVGTRTPTVYGRNIAGQLSAALAVNGVCVVSGLARGIDAASHEGAVDRPGGTIGVLGCAIDQVYPKENKRLYQMISEYGLIVSEYPLDTKPHPGLFPQRNRIIAGLCNGVLVVEAALRSGSLITVDQALEESRDIFAVPGPVTSPKSQGTHALIKQGAKLVGAVEDILEEYPQWVPGDLTINSSSAKEPEPELSADEQTIVDLLQNRAMTIDELLAGTQFNFGHLHSVLLNLLLTKRVEQLAGSLYAVY